jgi:hypothetical protein
MKDLPTDNNNTKDKASFAFLEFEDDEDAAQRQQQHDDTPIMDSHHPMAPELEMTTREPSIPVETVQTTDEDDQSQRNKTDYNLWTDDGTHPATRSKKSKVSCGAWAIRVSLLVFAILVLSSIVMTFRAWHQDYSHIAVFFVLVIGLFWTGLILLVRNLLQEDDPRLQPVRHQLQLIADQVTELFQDEYIAFQVEWKNYQYLLTNGEAEDDEEEDTVDEDANHRNPSDDPLASSTPAAPAGEHNKRAKKPKTKKKSILFQFVKPILKLKGGARNVLRRRRGGGGGGVTKQSSTTAFQTPADIETETSNNYLPPTSSTTVTTGVSV